MSGWPPRTFGENLSYHTFSRIINCEKFMKDDIHKKLMLQVIRETQKKYTFELCAYTILDEHFHFIIKTVTCSNH